MENLSAMFSLTHYSFFSVCVHSELATANDLFYNARHIAAFLCVHTFLLGFD